MHSLLETSYLRKERRKGKWSSSCYHYVKMRERKKRKSEIIMHIQWVGVRPPPFLCFLLFFGIFHSSHLLSYHLIVSFLFLCPAHFASAYLNDLRRLRYEPAASPCHLPPSLSRNLKNPLNLSLSLFLSLFLLLTFLTLFLVFLERERKRECII